MGTEYSGLSGVETDTKDEEPVIVSARREYHFHAVYGPTHRTMKSAVISVMKT